MNYMLLEGGLVVGMFAYVMLRQHRDYKMVSNRLKEIELALEEKTDTLKREKVQKVRTKKLRKNSFLLGIGGGGCNILSDILKKDKKFKHLYINSDIKTLQHKKNILTLQNNDLGCKGDVKCGKELITSNVVYKLSQTLPKDKKIFLLTTLGGGVGSGATIAIAKLLKSLAFDFHIVALLPFSFEGKKRMQTAQESLKELQEITPNISVIENAKILTNVEKKSSLKESFEMISDDVLELMLNNTEISAESGISTFRDSE